MGELLASLVSGLSRGVAIWLGQIAEQYHVAVGDDITQLQMAVGALVTALLWAGIHYVERKLSKK